MRICEQAPSRSSGGFVLTSWPGRLPAQCQAGPTMVREQSSAAAACWTHDPCPQMETALCAWVPFPMG